MNTPIDMQSAHAITVPASDGSPSGSPGQGNSRGTAADFQAQEFSSLYGPGDYRRQLQIEMERVKARMREQRAALNQSEETTTSDLSQHMAAMRKHGQEKADAFRARMEQGAERERIRQEQERQRLLEAAQRMAKENRAEGGKGSAGSRPGAKSPSASSGRNGRGSPGSSSGKGEVLPRAGEAKQPAPKNGPNAGKRNTPGIPAQGIGELREREEARTEVDALRDGEAGPIVGREFAKPGAAPIYYMPGIQTTRQNAYDSARKLAETTRHPVIPIVNDTSWTKFKKTLDERRELYDKLPPEARQFDPPGPFDELAMRAASFGEDIYRTYHDLHADPSEALEMSPRGMQDALLPLITQGKEVYVDAHSQGSANAQNGVQLIKRKLDSDVWARRVTPEERDAALSRITVFATGAIAERSRWPEQVNVVTISHPRDPVAMLGGNTPAARVPSISAHYHDENYAPKVGEIIKAREAAKARGQHGASGTW